MKSLLPATAVAVLATTLLAGGTLLSDEAPPQLAQADGAAKKAEAKKPAAKKKFRGRLPNYYGKVGVSNEQRQTIYGIQAKYHEQIEALERQIAELTEKRDAEIEAVLTPAQKARVKELVEAAKKKRAARKKKKAADGE